MIGCLMYLTVTHPNILNVVTILFRFMHFASEMHLKVAKRVIGYVKGTYDFRLVGFLDSEWGSSIDDMRSTLGYYFTFGSSFFSWCSKKQEIVA